MQPGDIDVRLGLDVGKSSHHACALDHDGNTILDTPVDQDEKQLRRTIAKLQRRGTVLVIVDQPNTIGSLPLTVARDMGARTAYLPGDAMRKAAQLLPGGSKTDRRDARIIASTAPRMPETLRDCEPDDETMAALRLLSGWDEDTAHELTRTVNRLRGLFLHLHPALERALAGDRIKSDTALGLLEHYKGPDGLRRAFARIRESARRHGLKGTAITDAVADAIGEQTVTVPGTRAAESLIPQLVSDLRRLRDRRTDISRQVEELLADAPLLTVLTSMPGIAARTASQMLLAIGGDIGRFKDAAHLAAYAGIAPVTRQSGTSIHGERPARGGNKRLKNALFQTAFAAIRLDPESRAYYDRKRAEGKRHNAAVMCLARRRCNVIYSMLRNGTLYQPGGTHTTTTTPPRRHHHEPRQPPHTPPDHDKTRHTPAPDALDKLHRDTFTDERRRVVAVVEHAIPAQYGEPAEQAARRHVGHGAGQGAHGGLMRGRRRPSRPPARVQVHVEAAQQPQTAQHRRHGQHDRVVAPPEAYRPARLGQHGVPVAPCALDDARHVMRVGVRDGHAGPMPRGTRRRVGHAHRIITDQPHVIGMVLAEIIADNGHHAPAVQIDDAPLRARLAGRRLGLPGTPSPVPRTARPSSRCRAGCAAARCGRVRRRSYQT